MWQRGYCNLKSWMNEKLHGQAYLEYNSWPKVLRNSLRNKGYIRWVDDQLDIHEDFFGLVHIEQTDAKSLYIATKIYHHSLLTATFALSWSRVTRFSETGWSRRYLRYTRTLLYSLLECVCKKHTCTIIRDSLDIVHDTSKLISNSPNRALVFSWMSRQLSPEAPGLKPLSNQMDYAYRCN